MPPSALTETLQFGLSWMQPELVLAGFALLATLIGAYGGARLAGPLAVLGAGALVVAGVLAGLHAPDAPVQVFSGSFEVDAYAAFAKIVIALGAAATLLLAAEQFSREGDHRFEFSVIVVLATLGMFVMVSANDLIALYIGVELFSLSAYVLAAWNRDNAKSSEAGLKYFVLGALSSGILLFGASLVYGFSGSVRFDQIAAAAADGAGPGMIFGLVFMLSGLAFKMSAAPFHMWTPDVYEGAPTPVTAFFAAAPKLAAVALTAQLLVEPFGQMTGQWQQVLIAIAALSMLVGSVIALVQTNIKRLMAYSSIANIGFALVGLCAGGQAGASAALLYMTIYLPTTIGLFALILSLRRDGQPLETIQDLGGLAQRHLWLAVFGTVLLFSMAGIPPLAGFWGKWSVFVAAVGAGLTPLVIFGVVCAVLAAGYYLRLIAIMWFSPATPPQDNVPPVVALTSAVSAALSFPVLAIGVGLLGNWIAAAAGTSFP